MRELISTRFLKTTSNGYLPPVEAVITILEALSPGGPGSRSFVVEGESVVYFEDPGWRCCRQEEATSVFNAPRPHITRLHTSEAAPTTPSFSTGR